MSAASLHLCVCLLGVEFLTLEKKSNLQDCMWFGSCGIASPTDTSGVLEGSIPGGEYQRVLLQPARLRLCLTALEMLSR